MSLDFSAPAHASAGPASLDIVGGRRAFIKALGLGVAGTAVMGTVGSTQASAQALTDTDILNFALNLEYLGSEFYLRASTGSGLSDAEVSGSVGTLGPVSGGRQVPFETRYLANFANELAVDERAHLNTLRGSLGSAAIARPQIDLGAAFTFAARGAGLIGPNDTFDAFANENNFLLSAFIFEDVCVTALTGAAPLLQSKEILSVAAGFLGVEAYQAGAIRTFLTSRGFFQQAGLISAARGKLDGVGSDDQGISDGATVNISPTDVDGLAFARTPQEVLRIAYLNPQGTPNGFFPMGVNGTIR
ncbi:ferritin-like domain-containing protein [Lichenihabitans sp. Uapishka_5]|uniref:ferritin-like domain-containing protein n=1 Tax=Lichenihabitans sp. Uapishka_5 TaxID=3037302 RepID=UPI0029E7DCEC|nr:ferritin-like domain-containing protein [Lichenihabitans sp. Uapishka_5]MDX7951736.1 ferritin-like domain-containing protein [Lichenihabitans sp. Uapishka_5]